VHGVRVLDGLFETGLVGVRTVSYQRYSVCAVYPKVQQIGKLLI